MASRAEEGLRVAQEQLLRQARELLASGGPFPPELLKLKEQIGAELVAESFEDVGPVEAARLEARLGVLSQALIVDDPWTTAHSIADRADKLADVLLVSRDAELDHLASDVNEGDAGERDVVVEEGIALRVSRVPSEPRLGRRAREVRAAQLRRQAEEKASQLDNAMATRRELERLIADGESLLAGHVIWLAGDPAPDLAAVKQSMAKGEAELAEHRSDVLSHAEAARALRPRADGLRALLGEAMLLDPPDYGELVRSLEKDCEDVRAAKRFVEHHERDARFVDRHMPVLRQMPLSEQDLARLAERVHQLKVSRERFDAGIDALSFLIGNAEALSWEEAPQRLASHQALVPSLQAQLRDAEERQLRAEKADAEAAQEHDEATAQFQDADGRRRFAAQSTRLRSNASRCSAFPSRLSKRSRSRRARSRVWRPNSGRKNSGAIRC